MNTTAFQAFFDCCVGHWTTERTYHYMTPQDVERSHTEFDIQELTADRKVKVLQDNQYSVPDHIESLPEIWV